MIRELKTDGILLVPICLRMASLNVETPEAKAAGRLWPHLRPVLVDWTPGWINHCEASGGDTAFLVQLCAFFEACLFHLSEWLGNQMVLTIEQLAESWVTFLEPKDEFWSPVLNRMME